MKTEWKKLNNELITKVFRKGLGQCWYCGKKLTFEGRIITRDSGPTPNTYVIDHIVPKYLGGGDEMENLAPCCWACNSRKGKKDLEDFREMETRLYNNAPKFTEEQLFYLARVGIALPQLEPYEFFFEQLGLK